MYKIVEKIRNMQKRLSHEENDKTEEAITNLDLIRHQHYLGKAMGAVPR